MLQISLKKRSGLDFVSVCKPNEYIRKNRFNLCHISVHVASFLLKIVKLQWRFVSCLLIKSVMTFKDEILKLINQNDLVVTRKVECWFLSPHLTNPIPDDVGGNNGETKYATPHFSCCCSEATAGI